MLVKIGVDGILDDAQRVVGPLVQVGPYLRKDVFGHVVERVVCEHLCNRRRLFSASWTLDMVNKAYYLPFGRSAQQQHYISGSLPCAALCGLIQAIQQAPVFAF